MPREFPGDFRAVRALYTTPVPPKPVRKKTLDIWEHFLRFPPNPVEFRDISLKYTWGKSSMQSDMPERSARTLIIFLKAIVKSNVPGNPVFLLCRPGLSSKLPLRGEKLVSRQPLDLDAS